MFNEFKLESEMSKFCEECPMRNHAVGEIVGVVSGTVESSFIFSRHSNEIGEFGAVIDENRDPSDIIQIPANWDTDRIVDAVDDCPGPVIEQKGIFKKRDVATECPALGRLACTDGRIKDLLRTQIR